ncbi:MAG: hypothetical protein FWC80_03340 [Firmicutes bacterium]|nr:hypothetical protein [Bacillota bacterium]
MRKFYLYTIKQSYIDKYGDTEASFKKPAAKVLKRPAICLKDSFGQNWLIPTTSLDQTESNYIDRDRKTSRWQQAEAYTRIKAIMRLPDVTGKKANCESVLQFFKATPIKAKDVNKYFYNKVHIGAAYDNKTLKNIEDNFKAYMRVRCRGGQAGFLQQYEAWGKNINSYKFNSIGLKQEIYKDFFALRKRRKESAIRKEVVASDAVRRKELKQAYKQTMPKLEQDGIRGSPSKVIHDNDGTPLKVSQKDYDHIYDREQQKLLTSSNEKITIQDRKKQTSSLVHTTQKSDNNQK